MFKLTQLEINKPALISRITGEDVESKRLHSMGIVPGKTIIVLRRTRHDTIHCRVSATEFAIRGKTAETIFVK